MQIIVSGKQMDVGDSLRAHAEQRLEQGIKKYTDRINGAEVVISKRGHSFQVNIVANTSTHAHMIMRSQAEADDVYAAFDAAADKIEKQLRRYKRKLSDHHRHEPENILRGRKYIINDNNDHEEVADAPVVIAEKDANVERLSVSEAVMRMHLADLPALMFINTKTGRMNVVYTRKDGNVSWIDPSEEIVQAA